jgi:tetratricopeptide (TPR) repeat protein
MATLTNSFGLAFTAASDASLAVYECAVTSYLAARTDTMALVDDLLAQDPDMVMAVCLRGYLLRLAAHPQFLPAIDASIEHAQHLVDTGCATPREQKHVAALTLWRRDHTQAALDCLEEVLSAYPLDMLALRIAHYLHFYNGRGEVMRDSTARVLDQWPTDHPHYHYLLGMHAFGLEEADEYEAALDAGRRAVAHDATDIWATHAVTHVLQMQGRHAEGLAWLRELESHWSGLNNFRNHVVWHGALHHIGLGQPEQALQIYDQSPAATVADDFYLDMCNNAALLWRLQFLGLDVGHRWQDLTQWCVKHARDQELLFASLHYLIPLAVCGAPQTQEVLAVLEAWAQQDSDQGTICRTVGVPLGHAIVQSPAEPAEAAQILRSHDKHTYLIGGSKAQRDLFALLAADNAHRANRPDLMLN